MTNLNNREFFSKVGNVYLSLIAAYTITSCNNTTSTPSPSKFRVKLSFCVDRHLFFRHIPHHTVVFDCLFKNLNRNLAFQFQQECFDKEDCQKRDYSTTVVGLYIFNQRYLDAISLCIYSYSNQWCT